MHMADALVSPAVGLSFWGVSAGAVAYSARTLTDLQDEKKAPLMGALGAFVFAAQMINFAIPGTGSSGHIGGGILLAALLGPHAAFLTIASILTIQALFFADGGLLALGCNIFNMGIITCYLAYPLVFKTIAKSSPTRRRLFWGSVLSCVLGLQLGALGVVLEVFASGITSLPLSVFLLFMQPIHLAIGFAEGLLTATVILYIWRERPEIIDAGLAGSRFGSFSLRPLLFKLALAGLITAGCLSWFASAYPDGLEWSIIKVTGQEQLAAPENSLHNQLSSLQEKLSFFPDYSLAGQKAGAVPENISTTIAGVSGALISFLAAIGAGKLLAIIYRKNVCLGKKI